MASKGGAPPRSEAFPEPETVNFGWNDDRKVSGRRKKLQHKAKPGSFDTMGLSEAVLRGIKRKGYRLPTPIQRKSVPLVLQGLDVVGMARTGSGKTAAFVVPLLERLKAHSVGTGTRGLILGPTRELALQTHKVVKELARYTDLRTACLVGGDSMEAQFAELAAFPDIIVATPGRLMHHLQEVDGFNLSSISYIVFDEADRLFEMGFAEQLKQILAGMSPSRQTLLFSATMPKALAQFARAGLKTPELVRLDTDTKISPELCTAFFTVRAEDKPAALLFLVRELIPSSQPTVVFAATRHSVEFLVGLLEADGVQCAHVHGAMDQMARKIHIAKFRAGKVGLMVVTDVAARGLDIPLLDNVINYDFPPKPKLFVHRTGRVARAGRPGTAYSLLTRDEIPYCLDLHLFLSRPLATAPVMAIGDAAATAMDPGVSLLGAFPQTALDGEVERVREAIASSYDLAGLQKPCENAFKLYLKTRPPAVPESVKRARLLPKEGMHPLLAAALPSAALGGMESQASLAAFTAALKSYRPSQTVFEAEMAPARRGEGAGSTAIPGVSATAPGEKLVEVMREKRAAHTRTIAAAKRQRKLDGEADAGPDGDGGVTAAAPVLAAPSGSKRMSLVPEADAVSTRFREEGFYVSHVPGEGEREESFYASAEAGQFNDAVLDLTAEDAAGMRNQKAQYHWDKRSKKYVKLQANETVKAGRRISGSKGGKDKAEPSGLYKKWAARNKLHVAGTKETAGAATLATQMGERFKRGGRGWVNPLKPGASGDAPSHVREEMKNPDQVRKQRRVEEKKREFMQQRQQQNSRGGGRGGSSRGGGRGGSSSRSGSGGGGRGGSSSRGGDSGRGSSARPSGRGGGGKFGDRRPGGVRGGGVSKPASRGKPVSRGGRGGMSRGGGSRR